MVFLAPTQMETAVVHRSSAQHQYTTVGWLCLSSCLYVAAISTPTGILSRQSISLYMHAMAMLFDKSWIVQLDLIPCS